MVRTRAWQWSLVVTAVTFAAYLALPSPQPVLLGFALYTGLGIAVVIAIVVGVVWHRPTRPAPWLLLAGGLALNAVGDMGAMALVSGGAERFPSPADLLYVATYPCLAAGLVLLVRARSPGGDQAGVIDAGIITVAATVLSWTYLMQPYASDSATPLFERAVLVAYPLGSLAVLSVAARLAVGSGARSPAFRLLGAAILGLLLSDVAYAVEELAGSYQQGDLADASYLLGYGLWAAAALHPSMRSLSEPAATVAHGLSGGRLAVLAAASVTAPLVLGVQWLRGAPVDVPVIVAGSVGLFGLVVARMAGLVGVVADLTRRRGEARFQTLIHHASDVVLILDPRGALRFVSPAVERVWGYPPDAFVAVDGGLGELVHPDDLELLVQRYAGLLEAGTGSTVHLEGRIRHADSSWRHFEAVAANLVADADVNGVTVTMRDVTERVVLEAQLTKQAFSDSLTGLANRARLLDRVELALTHRDRHPAVLFVDLDDFKTVNDSLGHDAGDQLLRVVTERLLECLRPADTAARLGGDEFAVLLDSADVPEAVAERILTALRRPVALYRAEIDVTASIGVAVAGPGDSAQDLLRNADTAMYAAKRAGKGRVEQYDPSLLDTILSEKLTPPR